MAWILPKLFYAFSLVKMSIRFISLASSYMHVYSDLKHQVIEQHICNVGYPETQAWDRANIACGVSSYMYIRQYYSVHASRFHPVYWFLIIMNHNRPLGHVLPAPLPTPPPISHCSTYFMAKGKKIDRLKNETFLILAFSVLLCNTYS